MTRLRSDFWVSAFIRHNNNAGRPAMLRRRGSPEAGVILIKRDRLDGTAELYGPAPQGAYRDDTLDRLFTRLHDERWLAVPDIEAIVVRELRFDDDIWLIEIEMRDGVIDLPLVAR